MQKDKTSNIYVIFVFFTFIPLLLLHTEYSFAQCEVKELQRPDGQTAYRVTSYPTRPISSSTDFQVALEPLIIGSNLYLTGIYRWRSNRKRTDGNLRLILKNGRAIELTRSSQQNARAGGSKVSNVLYNVDDESQAVLTESTINTINTKIRGEWVVLDASGENKTLKNKVNCLLRKTAENLNKKEEYLNKYTKYVKQNINDNIEFINTGSKMLRYRGLETKTVKLKDIDLENISITKHGHLMISCKDKRGYSNINKCITTKRKGIKEKTISTSIPITSDLFMIDKTRAIKAFRQAVESHINK